MKKAKVYTIGRMKIEGTLISKNAERILIKDDIDKQEYEIPSHAVNAIVTYGEEKDENQRE